MTTDICVYGTVFNSFRTLEQSIKSIFDPSYTIVITDNYSTDGTWEKLQELKKEYNLVLLRLRSSRGKGRDYSLRHCPENSITTYFDLDNIAYKSFHDILKSGLTGINAGIIIEKKEIILNRGGWKDLNAGEDFEFKIRVGFKYTLPVLVAKDLKIRGIREARYARNKIDLLGRLLKKYIDSVRACNYSVRDLLSLYEGKYKLLSLILYITPLLLGKYSYIKGINNCVLLSYLEVTSLINPKDIGLEIDDDFIALNYPMNFRLFNYNKYVITLEEFEKIIIDKLGSMQKYNYNGHIIYAKNEKAYENYLETFYI